MTIIKQKNQRVGVFIDVQNLYHSARNLYGANVNFANVLKKALSGRSLIRAIAYVITTESGEEKVFFEALEKAGIETKTKDLQIFYGGAKKADWDVGIAIDAIRLSSKLDAIVIVSGDGDFIPLVEYLKFNGGCQVEVMSFAKSSSRGLTESADDYIDMASDKASFLMIKKVYRKNKTYSTNNNDGKKEGEKLAVIKKMNNGVKVKETPSVLKKVKGPKIKKTTSIKKNAVGSKSINITPTTKVVKNSKTERSKRVMKKVKVKKEDNSTEIIRVSKKDIIVDGSKGDK